MLYPCKVPQGFWHIGHIESVDGRGEGARGGGVGGGGGREGRGDGARGRGGRRDS